MKLNADLGEHEPRARTRALMRLIDMANIACGVHAGSPAIMRQCVKLANEHGVQIGAHPGLSAESGRGAARISPAQLEKLVVEQVAALAAVAGEMRHIKLHGSLYHAVEKSGPLAKCYVQAVRENFPRCRIVARAGGRVADLCRESGVKCLPEAFAERGYLDNGTLVPRGNPGDVITSPRLVAARVRELLETGCMPSVTGRAVRIDAATICVHSDTPNAVRIARAVRSAIAA